VRHRKNLVAVVETQQVDFVAALFRAIWGAEPGRLPFFNRPSFCGEILCCWRPRWIAGTQGSPMHAYARYVWRKEPRRGPSFKVRVGRREAIAIVSEPKHWGGRDSPPTFLGSDELSKEGRGVIHSNSPPARQKLGRTRGTRHA
jgi:hypothetical protein